MLDENEMRTWEQRSSRGLLRGGGGQKRYPRSLEWPRMTNRLLTEHAWSEVVKLKGKSRKKYELSGSRPKFPYP